MSTLTQAELAYLASQRLGRLATSKADGTLQNSPVGFQYNPDTDTIDINGFNLATSQKYRNIARNGQAAFVVDDIVSVEPWRVRCLEIRADGESIEVNGVPLIRLRPRKVISFGIDEDVAAHELTVNSRSVE
jgi:pyridoxamine 5'-phosphate oxidase family protein